MLKNPLQLITSAVALLPTLARALVGIDWSITNVPASGLTDITFPFSIANSPHASGYYFYAQEFYFNGQSDVGYTGLQPRSDAGGRPVIHAVFLSYINGTTTTDSNCNPGADGRAGVSCTVEFSAPYGDGYQLVVRNTEGTTWSGTVVDATTRVSVHIGSWTLPAGTGGIKGSMGGFVTYHPRNVETHTCSSLPFTSMVFGVPTTTIGGAVGSLGDAYEYGHCVGKVALESQRTSQGVAVSVGFQQKVMTYLYNGLRTLFFRITML